MKKITLLILILLTTSVYSQVVLQDFTSLKNTASADVYGGFGGGLTADNALTDDPDNASNKVRKVTTAAGGDTWKGIFVRPQTHYIDLSSTKTVSVKVYSNTSTFLLGKIQAGQSSQADLNSDVAMSHGGTGWETLTFTFTSATGEYGEFVLFTNVDSSGAFVDPAVEVLTAYIDDVTAVQGSAIPAPVSGPTDSPTAPTHVASDVVSVFSDAYTDITTNFNPNWGQAGGVNTEYDPGDGNKVLLYSNFNYQGTEVTATDVSAMDKLHLDVWVADANVRTLKISPILAGGATTEFLVTVPLTSNSWNSVDISLSDFTGLDFSNNVIQLKFDGQFAQDGSTADTTVRSDIYLDNIYFYKGSTASIDDNNIVKIDAFPNPAANTLNISAKSNIENVQIFNILGKKLIDEVINTQSSKLDISNLNSGIYILKYKTVNGTGTLKFVKK